ncbi:tRNA pseudouridine synthase Pus10 [Metallosphaera sp. J1]|uniref:pseudouridylate synthase n=1 Tax=Metallosphaera TaxID=41980 RepID=UPI001EDECA2C|nr:pseudouridylate synthase [Metallosphaera javensis (ex Hofmann et al. 2022)]MCG3108789.1 tRNA pseudouridine synthase Pus10 [Metallosphaera javensis (ex Hofmann et al. 2022)]BCS94279.1 MAG: tRNA pseudouridine synthase Pus10 [Metallosphaera javensis (ex Sakai et al. 2022)]
MWKNSSASWVAEQALSLLERYPLCDSCLGRCFAKLGYGHLNSERGRSIKLSLILEIDRKIKEHQLPDLEGIREVLFNMGGAGESLFSHYFGKGFQRRACYLCNDVLAQVKEDFVAKALSILRTSPMRYVLGVRLSPRMQELETNFAVGNGLMYYESMKAEIRREVGKKLSQLGFEPDMDNPEGELVYDLDTRSVEVIRKNQKVLYLYTRLSRGVPISSWYSRGGDSLDREIGNKIIIPFTEPSDVRILEPYPLIIEDYHEERKEVMGYSLVKVSSLGKSEFNLLVENKPLSRTYRVIFYSTEKKGHEIYDGIQDMLVEARNFDELMEKIKEMNVEIISVDLIRTEGKHRRIRALLTKTE